MKTTHFILTIVGLCVLTSGLTFADESSGKPSRQKPATGGFSSALPQGSPAVPINAQPKSTPLNIPSQPVLNHAGTAAKGGLMMSQTGIQRTTPAKLPVGSGTTAASAGVVRSRSAGTASLGGLASVSAKNSLAVINGTAMKRKF
jgi:hypothetical protein